MIGLALCLLAGNGCAVLGPSSRMPAPYCDSVVEGVPRELDKVTMPLYRVAPPDILTIDVSQQVTGAAYCLEVGDVLSLSVSGAFPDEPIVGEYLVEASGLIELGYSYGAVEVVGLDVSAAKRAIDSHLRSHLREPRVSLTLRSIASMQQISGEHLVASDGTITLGQYGSLPVAGMSLDEVRGAVAEHLSGYFANPKVSVTVFAFNSQTYYIVTQGGGLGDGLVRLPYTGNETVIDAISQINGLSYVSSSRMWIARPDRVSGTSQILPVDWEAVTQRAEVETNYQLLPGDRLYIAHNRLVAFDGAIAKLTSPIERVFGFTLLGTTTTARLSGKVLRNTNSLNYLTPVR